MTSLAGSPALTSPMTLAEWMRRCPVTSNPVSAAAEHAVAESDGVAALCYRTRAGLPRSAACPRREHILRLTQHAGALIAKPRRLRRSRPQSYAARESNPQPAD